MIIALSFLAFRVLKVKKWILLFLKYAHTHTQTSAKEEIRILGRSFIIEQANNICSVYGSVVAVVLLPALSIPQKDDDENCAREKWGVILQYIRSI